MEPSQFSKANGILTAIFPDIESAQKAYNALLKRGYTKNEMNIVQTNKVLQESDVATDGHNPAFGSIIGIPF